MIHCELIFAKGVKVCVYIQFLKNDQLFQDRLLKDYLLSTEFPLLFIQICYLYLCESVSGSVLCHWSVSILLPILCCFAGFYLFIYLFMLFRALPMAYGSSQAGGQIRAAAASLYHSQSNMGSSRICNLHHSTQQHQILNPLIKGRNWTHVLMDTSQVRYCWATTGTSAFIFWVMDINSFCCTSKDVHCEEAEERGLNSLHMNQPEEHPSWIVMMDESWGSAQLGRVLVKTVLSSGAWRWATVKSQKNSTQHWVQRTIKSTGYEG